MENRVYYGEYTLEHWVKLILNKNIVIPPYQRLFVWDDERSKNLLKSIKKDYFVPPVTVGKYIKSAGKGISDNSESENLILDGQQRLTSIFLAYLGIFPDIEKIKKNAIEAGKSSNLQSENDYEDVPVEWRFDSLLSDSKDPIEITKKALETEYYKELDFNFPKHLFNQKYLGFSYLVPKVKKIEDQQNFYSSVFRDINVQGIPLKPSESRKSLYFLKEELRAYFDPSFANQFNIKSDNVGIDFVRYLSFLSEYEKVNQRHDLVGRLYANKFESYFVLYVQSMVGENDNERFIELPFQSKSEHFKSKIEQIERFLKLLLPDKEFDSIIDADVYLFGLVYFLMFKDIDINFEYDFDEFNQKLKSIASELKIEGNHSNNPNALVYLRKRIVSSIEYYQEFFEC